MMTLVGRGIKMHWCWHCGIGASIAATQLKEVGITVNSTAIDRPLH
jgi:hypothetical protein